ncbi:MAG: peptide chain release factor 2 [Capsulimonadaceae bacterium]|nr:peptide chain release factor 2 [Capsulimonadaceae bacterium]
MLDDVVRDIETLQTRFIELCSHLNLERQGVLIDGLESEAGQAGFWDDPAAAQEKMQRLNQLKDAVSPWKKMAERLEDLRTLIELAGAEDDPSAYEEEVRAEEQSITSILDRLEIETLLSGPHDDSNCYLEINAGAGGDEANDWASMLRRMYLRWAERRGLKAELLDEVEGDVAGIKSSTILISGRNAYGLMQGERGVHRLVRLSPFNANNKRQTSFAGVDVLPEVAEIENVDIDEKDLRIDYYRSSGAGGQHVNKTSSAVRITHIPTNIVVAVQNERSQHQNRDVAMKILTSRLLELTRQENKASINELRGESRRIEFGSQIRNYVFQPYTLVKDLRTDHETGDIIRVMDGEIDDFIDAFLRWNRGRIAEAEAEAAAR